jgi:hypothetical protein
MTEEGADIFIGGRNSDFEGFSSDMEDANRIRQKNALISQERNKSGRTLYMMIDVLAQNASHIIFNQITKSGLEY